MPYKEEQPRLIGCLAWIPLKQVVQKSLLGGRWLTQYNFFLALSYQHESGALIGRAKSNKLGILEKMLGNPATKGEIMQECRVRAKERLNGFKADIGKEPDNFHEFILVREFEKATSLRIPQCFTEAHVFKDKNMLKPFLKKVPLDKVQNHLYTFGLEGIGFGSSFPELTERMCRNFYDEKINFDEWTEARTRFGLDIPDKPEEMTFKEREESILGAVAVYTQEFYPELLDSLDLRRYLDLLK